MTKLLTLAATAVAIATPSAALAERSSDKVWVDAGGFWAAIDSDLRIDNQTLGIPGTSIDFERHLGLDDSRILPKVSGGVRIGSRFRFEADAFQLGRKNKIVLDETLIVDDTVFPINAEVESSFRTNIYRAALGYSLVRNERAEFGVAAGVHAAKAKFKIEANAFGFGFEEHRSKFVPMPNLGVYGSLHLFGPVGLQGNIDAFKIKYGDYKGSLVDAQISVDTRITKNIGVGIGFRHAGYRLTANKKDWRGKLSYQYSGPAAYVELAF